MRLLRNLHVLTANVGLAVLAAPSAAWADDGGMPQFNPSFFPEQLFWLAVTFGFLYVMMACVALPRVTDTKDNRKQVLTADLEAARVANENAKMTAASIEESLAEARAGAQAEIAAMIAQQQKSLAEHGARQKKELMDKLHHAETDIKAARDKALGAVRDNASELASAIVKKILSMKPVGSS